MFMLEAMACSKPLLAFNLPFSRAIITNGETGLLSQVRDVKSLSNNIELLYNDEKLRKKICENASIYIRNKHNWDKLADKYLEIYKKVVP